MTARHWGVVIKAEQILMRACGKRFGFPWEVSPTYDDVLEADERVAESRVYGITDPVVASKYGYLPAPSGTSQEQIDPPSSASLRVMEGIVPGRPFVPTAADAKSPGYHAGQQIPPGGCRGEARIKIWGDPSSKVKFHTAKDLEIQAYFESQADRRVQALFAEWSACMKGKGYKTRRPDDAESLGFAVNRPEDAPAPPAEVQAALADIACKKKVNLVQRWNAVDIEYQQRALEKHQLQLQEERTGIDAAVRRAAAVANSR